MHSEPYKEEQPYGCIFLAIHLEVKKVCLSQHSARRPINHVSIEMNVWYVVVLGGWALGNKRLLHFVRYVGLNYFVCTTAVDKANIHLGSSNAVAKLRWEYSVVRHQTNVHARPLSASLHVLMFSSTSQCLTKGHHRQRFITSHRIFVIGSGPLVWRHCAYDMVFVIGHNRFKA